MRLFLFKCPGIIILTTFLQDFSRESKRSEKEHSELCDWSCNAESREKDKKMLKQ